ncbi:heavy metal translocating P-type ATPase [Helicobacter sp. T3_23-1056]
MTAYKIQNLDCSNCANKLEKALNALPSVRKAKIAFASDMLYIDCDDLREVKECIKQIEPQVEILDSINTKYSWINAELVKLFGLIFVFLASLVFEHLYLDYFDEGEEGGGAPSMLEIFATMGSNATNGDFWLIALYVLWVAIYVLAGKSVLKGAYTSFKKREFFDENVLMLSASVAAFCIGASEEAVSIMLFFSAGEYLQNLSVKKSKESINALSSFDLPKAHRLDSSPNPSSEAKSTIKTNPTKATKSSLDSSLQPIVKSTNTCDIDAKDLREGDEILLYVGEMLPADCVLLSEEASFDMSAISGESLPSSAKSGDEILSGSIALHKVAHLKVLRHFAQSQIAKITELIASASSQKSPTENFITTFSRYYTPIVFFIALLVAFVPPFLYGVGILGGGSFGVEFREWAYRALVVLMVSCPCALVVSVPIGYFGGIAASSRLGVLIKGSNYLEALSRLVLLGFDKTGTITKGVFKVTDIVPQDGVSQMELLGYALCAQDLSSHPIAQSIKKEYHRLAKESKHSHHISEYEEISGLGVRARCDNIEIIAGNDKILHKFEIPHNTCDIKGSVVHIAVQKRYLGYLIISDELKEEAKEVVENLKTLGIKPVLLSGDSLTPCKAVGDMLGIEYFASLLPQDKATTFAKLKSKALAKAQQNHATSHKHQAQKVGFVGDGINDAPTLALADVGISMGSGSDISQQNANVIILNNSLTSLLKSIKIAKKTKTIIYENIAFALGVKGVFVILGLFGWATIWEAVFCDVGVALLALANAMRTMRL